MNKFFETRETDLEEGKQIDISDQANKSGLPFAVYTTSKFWEECVKPDIESVKKGENEKQRVHVILDNLVYSIRVHRRDNRSNLLSFDVPITKSGKSEIVKVISYLGPKTKGSKEPSITLILPEEIDQ